MSSGERNTKHPASGIRIYEPRRIEGAAACRTTEIESKCVIVCGLLHPSPQVSGILVALHRCQRRRLCWRAAILSAVATQQVRVAPCSKDQEKTIHFPSIDRDRSDVVMLVAAPVRRREALIESRLIDLAVVAGEVVVFVPCTFSTIKSVPLLLRYPPRRTCYLFRTLLMTTSRWHLSKHLATPIQAAGSDMILGRGNGWRPTSRRRLE